MRRPPAVPPTAPQTDPWDPSTGPPGQVLLGQFSTTNGTGFYGTFLIQFIADGVPVTHEVVAFEWLLPAPGALGLLGLARAGRRR